MAVQEALQLQQQVKASLLALSHLISFYSTLERAGASQHAHQAPKQLTTQLNTQIRLYQDLCTQLEQRILRAIATLERDSQKTARGDTIAANLPFIDSAAEIDLPAAPVAALAERDEFAAMLKLAADPAAIETAENRVTETSEALPIDLDINEMLRMYAAPSLDSNPLTAPAETAGQLDFGDMDSNSLEELLKTLGSA